VTLAGAEGRSPAAWFRVFDIARVRVVCNHHHYPNQLAPVNGYSVDDLWRHCGVGH
jgi:hypothetical protein